MPPDAKFEGYRDFVVQDTVMESRNTRYRRAVYRLTDGSLIVGQRPDGVNSRFGPALIEFVLVQTHQNDVTQGRLLEQLMELGVEISAGVTGQISNFLLRVHDQFHAEKDELLLTLQVYQRDRIRGRGEIPLLTDLMRKTAAERGIAAAS